MTKEGIEALYQQQSADDRPPDYSKWLAKDCWYEDELCCLLIGLDPYIWNGMIVDLDTRESRPVIISTTASVKFAEMKIRIQRVIDAGKLKPVDTGKCFKPSEVIAYLDDSELTARGESLVTYLKEQSKLTSSKATTSIVVGISRNLVMNIFAVETDYDANCKFWDKKLSNPPEWLKPALLSRGKPGTSSRWSPLMVGHCLLDKGHMNLKQLGTTIHKNCPELYDQWKEETADKR